MPFLALLLLFASTQLHAAVKASVDYRSVRLGQNIQFNLSSDNAAGAIPNLAILKRQFRVLGTSMVSRPYIKNGKRAQKTIWYYILRPKHAGTLTIPSISINGEKSNALSIKVTGAVQSKTATAKKQRTSQQHKDIKVLAKLDKKKAYPHEQLTYSIEAFYPSSYSGKVSLKAPFAAGAIIIAIDKSAEQPAQRGKVKGFILKQRFAIFAEQVSRYQVTSAGAGYKKDEGAEAQALKAAPLNFEITPQANKTSFGYWLPSPEVDIKQRWTRPKTLYVGDVIEREITLSAQKLNSDILPLMSTLTHEKMRIKLLDVHAENTRQEQQLNAQRTEKVSMTLTSAGQISLPPIDIHWWNTAKHHAQVSTLSAYNFTVLENPVEAPPSNTAEKQTANSETKTEVAKSSALDTIPKAVVTKQIPEQVAQSDTQSWIIAILAALLVLTSCGWLLSLSNRATKP